LTTVDKLAMDFVMAKLLESWGYPPVKTAWS